MKILNFSFEMRNNPCRLPTGQFVKNMGNMGIFGSIIWVKYRISQPFFIKIWDIYMGIFTAISNHYCTVGGVRHDIMYHPHSTMLRKSLEIDTQYHTIL